MTVRSAIATPARPRECSIAVIGPPETRNGCQSMARTVSRRTVRRKSGKSGIAGRVGRTRADLTYGRASERAGARRLPSRCPQQHLNDERQHADVDRMAPDSGAASVIGRSRRLLSPSRLNDFLGCEHRTYLDLLAERGEIPREDYKQPDAELLLERGRRHEETFLETLRAEGHDVVAIPEDASRDERAAATEAAMRDGREVIHQAAFVHDGWVGYADFLIRVEEP